MKFNNCVAWAKGCYKTRNSVSAMWMDLAHCINNDGWMAYSKQDVVKWCLNILDKENDFFKKTIHTFGFSELYRTGEWYIEDLSFEDKVIHYFKHCLYQIPYSEFEKGGYKPANWVLPLYRREAYYDSGTFTVDGKPQYCPSEMTCDAEERVDKAMPDLDKQNPYYVSTDWRDDRNFDTIESRLRGKNWKDVVTDLGCEVDCNMVCDIPGETLFDCARTRSHLIITDPLNSKEEIDIDLGRYSYSVGYDMNKTYQLRIKKTKNPFFDDYDYVVLKIEEK